MPSFEIALKELLKEFSEDHIRDYFDTILTPINRELDNEASNVSAKTLRVKRQQTNHIRNIFLTLRNK